jgi:NDP-sugar pyrophosphorylase family protein
MAYRHLTKEEVTILLSQNCSAGDWTGITVKEEFSPANIRNTRLEGKIKLGIYTGTIETEKSVTRQSGIYNSYINNCDIGDNVYISDVKNLSNYDIEENVAVSNVGSMIVTGESAFGNGTEIEVLNEGGGRELPVFDRLSAQIAYMTVLYRHDKELTESLLHIIRDYCDTKRSNRGLVQTGARIINCLIIRNVSIGIYTTISGAALLEEGTIAGCREAPSYIGVGVIARDFIVLSGSRVDEGSVLSKSFIGQGVKMGKQFSAEGSAFFANCEAFHGEACSLFAGPYTVTHHKSTLMIASLTSFFNAGSGTNQSNHMYKLGPLHQGILERGSKTGSFSYLLLPCHIGAYTVVMGKHYANFDTSDFPFSYITEEKGKSELTPAMNLFTVGTRRDCDKWPVRDRRKDPDKLDLIHFNLFNPYIGGKILSAINILSELSEKTDQKQEYVNHKGIGINRLLLKTTRKYYEMAMKIYIGREVVARIRALETDSSVNDLKSMLAANGSDGTAKWVDICGLFAPEDKIGELIGSLRTGGIDSLEELQKQLASIYTSYDKYAWNWCFGYISRQAGADPENIKVSTLIQIIADWKTNSIKLNNMILKDAEKEFDASSKIGFGLNGDANTRESDFQNVRGVYDKDKFVSGLRKESIEIEYQANRLTSILESLA